MLPQMGGLAGMFMGGYNVEERANNVCSSIFWALCIAPVIILVSICGLAWNEREAVCRDRTIQEARLKVEVVGCNETDREDLLVMLNCPIVNKSLEAFHGEGLWQNYSQIGVGFEVIAEMRQCIQTKHEHSTKNGGHHEVTYEHSIKWAPHHVDSTNFETQTSSWKEKCGAHNPGWPAGVPHSKRKHVKEMYVGSFKSTMAEEIPLDARVDWPVPEKWQLDEGGHYVSNQWEQNTNRIGRVRVKFLTNDWTEPDVTLVGESSGGRIRKWTASPTSMCTGFTLHELKVGTWKPDMFFDKLEDENMIRTWLIRATGFAGLWLAFCFCLSPVSALGEAIPFFGECVGEAISALACLVACVPATAVCTMSAGFVWMLMRPMIGGPLVLCSLVLFAIACVGGVKVSRAQRQGGKVSTEPLLSKGDLAEPGLQQLQMASHAAPTQGQPQQQWQQPQQQMNLAGSQAFLQQPAYQQQRVQPANAGMAPGVPPYAQASAPAYAQAPCRQPQVAAMPAAPAIATGARPWETASIVQDGAAAAAAAVTAAAAAGVGGAPGGNSGVGNTGMGGQMMVQVPAGSGPGMSVQVHTPEGVPMQVVVPAGAVPGSNFLVQY